MNDLRKASFFAPLDGVIDEAVAFLESESLLLVTCLLYTSDAADE